MASTAHQRFHGIIANLPTTFQDDGKLDTGRLAGLIDFVLDAGAHGVSCLLSSGLFPYLEAEEREAIVRATVDKVAGRGPVLVGVGGQTTDETIAHARRALDLGADGLLVLPLSYWRMREPEVLAHYKKVLGSADAEWGIYNAPQTTGIDLSAAMYKEIASYGNLTFTKDASGDILRGLAVQEALGQDFTYLCGMVHLLLPSMLMGGHGACLALGSLIPAECRRLYDLTLEGNTEEARAMYRRLLPLFQFFQKHTMFRSVRLASEIMGRPVGPLRMPLRDLEPSVRQDMQKILAQCELLPAG